MSDYKRLVSYIYAYPNAVRGKNVGFAKAEVRNGRFKLSINLKGVYTDSSMEFGIYILVDKNNQIEGRFNVVRIGSVSISNGVGNFVNVYNPDNINESGYAFENISGIAIALPDKDVYMMFSMWEDVQINPDTLNFIDKKSDTDTKKEKEEGSKEESQIKEQEIKNSEIEKSEIKNSKEKPDIKGNIKEFKTEEPESESEINKMEVEDELVDVKNCDEFVSAASTDSKNVKYNKKSLTDEAKQEITQKIPQKISQEDAFKKIFEGEESINVFDDDYYYNCIEVTPDKLKMLPIDSSGIANNSFLMHGYYNFKHILFGKVRENDNNTKYFIGVPGMYCNRERFMASMFGFNNFKKSHRSDYSNPYFGYWYQEI